MFTVIIAEKETLKLFEETKMFFGPLMDKDKVAFCRWDRYGDSIDTMLPELYDTIEFHQEWRAIVFCDDNVNKQNPFDYTEYSEPYYSNDKKDWEYYEKRREQRLATYEKASQNPLFKLSAALCGIPNIKTVVTDEADYKAILNGDMKLYEYMLKSKLEKISCYETAFRFERYHRDALSRFVADESIDELISCVRNADVSGILNLIPDTDVLDFIECIEFNPMDNDPEFAECVIENTGKQILFNAIADAFSVKDKLPTEVICLSPRTFNFKDAEQDIKWKEKDERSYSRFSEFNLYSDKLKFLLFDVLPRDNKQYKFDEIKLLCMLLLIANNEMPQSAVTASHVYRANINMNSDIVTRICENYVSKLKATEVALKEIEMSLDSETVRSISDDMAQRIFEADVKVPVEIKSSVSETDLYAQYNGVGLATDCPEYESVYWGKQYREISKKFHRYLREPGRALRAAVADGLRDNNKIDDERSLLLSVNQTEDIKYHLAETEQRMIEATTKQIYDTKKFVEEIRQADKEINRKIEQRMTKGKTVTVALIALATYLLGFVSVLFSNLNSTDSLKFSVLMVVSAIAVFLLTGFICLFSLRRKLVNRIKHFNYVMSGIQSQIRLALSKFSVYLSCVCNVMRDFSALEKKESTLTKTKRILIYHDMRIKEKMETVYDLFSKYVDFNSIEYGLSEPYDYDFTILRDYEYEMPDIHSRNRIEFLQPGNEIVLPVDYVDSVSVIREELYD